MKLCNFTGDVDGSVEAILGTISTYNSRQCHLHIMSYDVGVVTEQDVETAAPFNGRTTGDSRFIDPPEYKTMVLILRNCLNIKIMVL